MSTRCDNCGKLREWRAAKDAPVSAFPCIDCPDWVPVEHMKEEPLK